MSINLRDELKTLLEKYWDYVIVRHMTEQPCPCMTNRQASKIADPSCPNCEGSGYVFEEYFVKCKTFWSEGSNSRLHNFNYGQGYGNSYRIYLEASERNLIFRKNDIVYTLETDIDGKVKDPFVRLEKWPIIDVDVLKLDSGKVEFIKFYLKPEIV